MGAVTILPKRVSIDGECRNALPHSVPHPCCPSPSAPLGALIPPSVKCTVIQVPCRILRFCQYTPPSEQCLNELADEEKHTHHTG